MKAYAGDQPKYLKNIQNLKISSYDKVYFACKILALCDEQKLKSMGGGAAPDPMHTKNRRGQCLFF